MNTDIEDAAKNYPETKFAIIDASFENQPENVSSLMFNAAGSAGLGSIEAAKESNKMAVGVDKDQNSLAP